MQLCSIQLYPEPTTFEQCPLLYVVAIQHRIPEGNTQWFRHRGPARASFIAKATATKRILLSVGRYDHPTKNHKLIHNRSNFFTRNHRAGNTDSISLRNADIGPCISFLTFSTLPWQPASNYPTHAALGPREKTGVTRIHEQRTPTNRIQEAIKYLIDLPQEVGWRRTRPWHIQPPSPDFLQILCW